MSEASRSNWFGLGCPLHCTQPGVSSLLLAFVLGFILGISFLAFLLWRFWTFLLPAPASTSPQPLFPLDTRHSPSICMSRASGHDVEPFDITCNFKDLRVSVRGPPDQVSELIQVLTAHFSARDYPASCPSESSFDFVEPSVSLPESSSPSLPVARGETRGGVVVVFDADDPMALPAADGLLAAATRGEGRMAFYSAESAIPACRPVLS